MKKVSMWVLLAAVGVAASSFVWADHHEGGHKHAGWFDCASCEICKPWSENASLMTSTKWETHTINSGMLMVTMVPEDQMETFNQVCSQCKSNAEKIAKSGKEAEMCGFCGAMGKLMQAGVKMEEVKTEFGKITLLTSDDSAMVKKIHDFAKRSQEEAKKMLAAMKQKT